MLAAIEPGTSDEALLDDLPWGNFPDGAKALETVRLLRTGDGCARNAMNVLYGMCAEGSRAAIALAVPVLIRIAIDPHHPQRAHALDGLAAPARARYFGVASRTEFLLHRSGPQHEALDGYDDYGVEVTGYPAGWSVAGARAAITARAPVLMPLLDDPDPAVRIGAAYALATAVDPDRTVRAAFAARFEMEQDPMVRAAVVLATAEITRAHPHRPDTAWIRGQWQDRAQAPEVRLAAAIGWLCLTDEPAPDALRTTVDALATEERARAMEVLPWMAFAGGTEPGLVRCVRSMLHPEGSEPSDDPWAQLP
ncbi:HEAT repeat domain-containing protein [Streptomyces sp. LN699]|uniref:HEAT repeat domain-containing protein n=1 Tax=Streptomyces sp. LN699 TaxID=3112981 RepID=UPI003716E08A